VWFYFVCVAFVKNFRRRLGPLSQLQCDVGKKVSLHGKTHSLTVFIATAANVHSHRVISIKSLSNLLCNFHISLQFSCHFAIFISVCNSHVSMHSSYVEVCNFHMPLQFSYAFAIFISVCNSHGMTPALTQVALHGSSVAMTPHIQST
jgi:hypothetical protein